MTFPLVALLLASPPEALAAHAARTAKPPVIDGRLDDAAWLAASPLDTFTQGFPVDGAPPTEHTSMLVLYDDDAIYFGFDCEQLHAPVIERLTRRDRDSESEWISIRIDPRNEGKVAFTFGVSASGVLADGLITEPNEFNLDWDENWEAAVARTPRGWTAELRIPLRVLRFDASQNVQRWSIQAARSISQKQEYDMWPYVARDVANPLSHFGTLDGLVGLKAGGKLELRPFVTGRARRLDESLGTSDSGYDLRAAGGLDLKLHLTQNFTLDAAFLPDFGQVEADQVILNLTNYETFLPEKRPLFLEGADVFAFPLQIFYSRRIGLAPMAPTLAGPGERLVSLPEPTPIYGATKVVGRIARGWTLGALAAVTGRNEVGVDDGVVRRNRQIAPLAAVGTLRLKREWAGTGHVGLMATSVTAYEAAGGAPALCPSGTPPVPGGSCFRDSYVAGVDGLWRSPSGDYVANGAVIQSLVRGGPNVTQLDGTVIGSGARAPGGWARVAKEGGRVLASVAYLGAGRTLDYNDLGFMPRQNLHEVKAAIAYRTLVPGRFTIETSSALEVTQRRSLAGLDLGQTYSLSTRLKLLGFWSVFAAADLSPPRFDDREIGNGAALERGAAAGGRLEVLTDPKREVVGALLAQAQAIEHDARALSAQASITLLPLPQVEIALAPQLTVSSGEYRYTTLPAVAGSNDLLFGKLAATSVGATLRVSYTFAPHLSLQTYAQAFVAAGRFTDLRAFAAPAGQRVRLDALAAAPMPGAPGTSPDFAQAALNLNVVLRWEYRLGSTLFLVYSRSQVPDLGVLTTPGSLRVGALGQRASADVILLKLSYWWGS